MAFTLKTVDDIPVIICEAYGTTSTPEDVNMLLDAVVAFKKERGGCVYRLIDLTDLKAPFSDMMVSMGVEVGREGGSNDSDVITVFVATGDLYKLGAKSLQEQAQYGQAPIKVFPTREEALASIREELKQ